MSVGYSFAVLQGRVTGDEEKAYRLINSMTPEELVQRNRDESKNRLRAKVRKRRVGRVKHG